MFTENFKENFGLSLPWYLQGSIGGVNPDLWLEYNNNRYAVDQSLVSFDDAQTYSGGANGTFVDSDGVIQDSGTDEPRLDYVTGTRGLLLEDSRTNLFQYSEDFTQWTITAGFTVTSNQETAPDGNTTADLLTSTNNSNSGIQENVTLDASDNTLSFYVKSGNTQWFRIVTAGSTNSWVDIINGVTGTVNHDEINIIDAGDDWYRVEVIDNYAAGSTNINFLLSDGNGSLGELTNGTAFIWGAQIEKGSFPTSYVSTNGSTVNRSLDRLSITGTEFTNFYNQSEGTFLVDGIWNGSKPSVGGNLFWIDVGNATGYVQVSIFSTSVKAINQEVPGDGGAFNSGNNVGTLSSGDRFRVVLALNGTSNRIFMNGVGDSASSFTTSTIAQSMSRFILSNNWNFGAPASCSNYEVRFYPEKLSDTDALELSQIPLA